MGNNGPSTIGGLAQESQCGLNSPSMKDSGMVSNVVVTSGGVSTPSTSTQGCSMSSTPSSSSFSGGHSAVGYIRKGCRKGDLSDQASSLILTSWRSKSNSNYKLLFHKWECWCHSRDRNPISGLIADVLNS